MKLGNDSSVTVENSGENQGIIAGANYGSMTQNHYGLGYSDTKALCLDIVRDEMTKYHDAALIEIQKRFDELFELLVKKLQEKNMTDAQALVEFKNPAMQFDYFEAQKAYMKAGTPELAEMLSDILVERISESSRSLLQIALGEAIQVAPKLIPAQMATLALAFNIKYVRRKSITTLEDLVQHIRGFILPIFKSGVSDKRVDFQHLSFTGCCQLNDSGKSLAETIRLVYSGLFFREFAQVNIEKDEHGEYLNNLYPQLFTQRSVNKDTVRLATINADDLDDAIAEFSIPQMHADGLRRMFRNSTPSADEIQKNLKEAIPEIKEVFQYWDNSQIKNAALSTVGIIIGAEYSHQITDEHYDLKIWI